MQHLLNRGAREQIYRAFLKRASAGEQDNAPLIREILALKQEMARALGYATYAEMSLDAKMAPSVAAVDELSELLRAKSFPMAQRELAELQEYAAARGFEGPLALWDVSFWAERQKEEKYAFQEEELRPYFPLPAVQQGMFGLAGRLFGVEIVPAAAGDSETWHPDVSFWHVNDAETGRAGRLFLPGPLPRPAEARAAPGWMCVSARVRCWAGCGGVPHLQRLPPVGDKPSLMTFQREWRRCSMSSATACSTCSRASPTRTRPASTTWSGTPSSCPRSSWRTGATTSPPCTSSPSTTRPASRCPRSSSRS
ncbi:unnamed protein product [Heterosigma akashiwo]